MGIEDSVFNAGNMENAISLHPESTTILVEGLQIETYIGPESEESDTLQTVLIDIAYDLAPAGIEQDELPETVDYVPIVAKVRELALQKRKLIETLSQDIAQACFAYPKVARVRVTIRKPHKLEGVEAVGTIRTFTR